VVPAGAHGRGEAAPEGHCVSTGAIPEAMANVAILIERMANTVQTQLVVENQSTLAWLNRAMRMRVMKRSYSRHTVSLLSEHCVQAPAVSARQKKL